ncbi:hypothetical protein EW145_g532 [Phellinidium pouzarii]|uniref:C2 domain-containing protein n=1 Tax=Phellinidium pouzarii TaxID=167371 RepID=A0A4S4LHX3_9AGAM|nr:hypothetical protein EW145_g532 [Phellinidium pouzarii]
MSHKLHEGYSAKNPVPKVALKSILDPSGATEAKARRLVGDKNQDEKMQQDEMQYAAKRFEKGKTMDVKDPVTGEETPVKHGSEEQKDPEAHKKGHNILTIDYPPPNWSAHRSYVLQLTRSTIIKIMVFYAASPVLAYFIFSIPLLRRMQTISESHPLLGFTAGEDLDGNGTVDTDERIKESAEWLNSVLKGVWPIINPDMFSTAVDILEDIMQASVPKFVHSVRVADLGQGTNALRVTSIRSLPDTGVDEALQNASDAVREHLLRDHVNIEVSFAYRALPSGTEAASKAHNAHLLIEFYLGMKGVYEFKLPVWVELKGVSGTARARLELIPDPPFIKTALVTLMGLPSVSISVVPMSRTLPNVMNLPFLSSFISKSIDTACAEYVAPRSLTLDLQQLLSGDDIKKDTTSIGVIIIHIHRATGLKKMDTRKSSDPYVTIAYSRQGKPLYSTRIIFSDLNPCFEETAAVTVDANAVKIREKLTLQLWDSDRASADDMMGYVEIDILDLLRNTNTPKRQTSFLTNADIGSPSEQSLEYTIGYYAKMAPNNELATDGSDPAIPEDLKLRDPDFREARSVALNDLEASVLVTPPDPNWPSGILSVQIHEVRDLKLHIEGRETSMLGQGRKEGQKGQDDDGEEQEEGSGLPSSYCTIVINDNLIYSTRVKPITSTPIFNAGTERFIRNWRTSHVSVAVRDSRMRENDPILGIVFLQLSELLVNASEVTRFFPLENGLGYGSVRISILFRPVQASLPPCLLGFDAGTLFVRKLSVKPDVKDAEDLLSSLQSCSVKMRTSAFSDKVSRKNAQRTEDGSVVWNEDNGPSEIAVKQRYSTAFILTFKKAGNLKTGNLGMAVLWLRDVVDSEDSSVEIALFKSEDKYNRLKQNYVPPDGSLDMWVSGKEKLMRIGTVRIELTLQPGIGTAHEHVLDKSDPGQKRMWDEVNRRDDVGLQEKVRNQDAMSVSGENTEVSKDDVQIEAHKDRYAGHPDDTGILSDAKLGESSNDSDEGLLKKLRDWKHHEKELHQQHRGIMQNKSARTAVWFKDNVKEAGYKAKGRFIKMQPRQPDVETEI